jgi:hypothetical protein
MVRSAGRTFGPIIGRQQQLGCEFTLQPAVGFGDGSLDFAIRAFVDSVDERLRVQHEISLALDGALRENGIEIASGVA